MKLTETKLKQLILETYLEDIMVPVETMTSGKIIWPRLPYTDLVQKKGGSDQVKQSTIFKKRPLKSFLAGVNGVVDEFSNYYPTGENGKKTKQNSFFNYGKGSGRMLTSPDGKERISIKANTATYRVQVKFLPFRSRPSSALLRLQDYQRLPEGEEFNIFLARIREQIKSYIEANSW